MTLAQAAQAQTPPALDDAQALAPFFKALADVKSGARTRPVHVIQLGDSHTAADHITGALRARLQARFGEGGRGALPPGRPFAAYSPRQVEVDQSDGWRLEASFVPANWGSVELGPKRGQPAPIVRAAGSFGLSGWRLVSARPGASVSVKADPEARFDRAVVCGLANPGGGAIVVQAGGKRERFDLSAEHGPVCKSVDFGGPQSALDLVAEGGSVTLTSFATFRDGGGVVVSNFGVIGTTLYDLAARDETVMAAELKAYQPDLIVLAFGTNDGFQRGGVDGPGYQAEVKRQLERLKRIAPGVSVLVLGPPDANMVRPDIPEDGKANAGFQCAPLTAQELADYPQLVAARSSGLARWYPPPALAVVREAQRSAATQEGAAFWDWSARMGGACSAHHLSQADPRLVHGDHIHFTTMGGDMIADMLSKDLMGAFDAQAGQAGGGK